VAKWFSSEEVGLTQHFSAPRKKNLLIEICSIPHLKIETWGTLRFAMPREFQTSLRLSSKEVLNGFGLVCCGDEVLLMMSGSASVDLSAVQGQSHMKRCFLWIRIESHRAKMLLDDSLHGIQPQP
jgi:hypothetical protein